MKTTFCLLLGALIAPACTGAIGDGPLSPASGVGGDTGSGSSGGGASGSVNDSGVAGSQGTSGSGAATGTAGGAPSDGGTIVDPFAAAPVCTSNHTWIGVNHGSASMNPGLACISCHSKGEGPPYELAGTVYPTAHEPDLCDGVNGSAIGAKVVIVDANGQSITMTPNAVGNFDWAGTIATPYHAKVVYMGRERAMLEPQISGDCNNCHTQQGAMPTGPIKAPGRILLP